MQTGVSSHTWLVTLAPRPLARVQLVCFPYAGGGASAFSSWSNLLPRDVELCAVQLPGREARLSEPHLTEWSDAVAQLASKLTLPTDRPCAFFGHSLGAAIAFELAHHYQQQGKSGPIRLFVSGRRAPHLARALPPLHDLPHEQFVEQLRQFAGTPEALLQNAELLDLFVPTLRADFRLSDTYCYRDRPPLRIPITAIGGCDDSTVSIDALDAWREHTTSTFRRVSFPGGHFFLNENRIGLVSELTRDLHALG